MTGTRSLTRLNKLLNDRALSSSNPEDYFQSYFHQQTGGAESGEPGSARTLNLLRKKSDKHESALMKDSRKNNNGVVSQSQEFSKLKNELLKAHIKNENLVKILKEKEKEQLWSQAVSSLSNQNSRTDQGENLRKSIKLNTKRTTNISSVIVSNGISFSNHGVEAVDSATFALSSPRPSMPSSHFVQSHSSKKKAVFDSDSMNTLRGSREGSRKPSKFSQHDSSSNSRNRTTTTYDFKSSFVDDDFNLYDHSFYSSNFTFKYRLTNQQTGHLSVRYERNITDEPRKQNNSGLQKRVCDL